MSNACASPSEDWTVLVDKGDDDWREGVSERVFCAGWYTSFSKDEALRLMPISCYGDAGRIECKRDMDRIDA